MGKGIRVRRFTPRDALPLSALIRRALFEENSRDYSLHELEAIANGYSPDGLKALAANGRLYVATNENGERVGCGAVAQHGKDPAAVWIHAVFTHPGHQRTGVGRAVMATLEADPICRQASHIELAASLTAEAFYQKLGYTYTGGIRTITKGTVPMQKWRQP